MRLGELAERLGCRLDGDPDAQVRGAASLEAAGPDDLTFVGDARHLPRLSQSRAAVVVLRDEWPAAGRPALRAANPLLAFARALAIFYPVPPAQAGIHPTAVVDPSARVDASAEVGPLCVVGRGAVIGPRSVLEAQVFVGAGAVVGADCRVLAQTVLRDGTQLGDRVVVHSGTVLGADGFGYVRDGARHVKIPQVGRVVIEDDVEIGANTAIDRATFGETRIGHGTKIDNLVQVAHNVVVGADAILVAQVGIAGSSRIGARATLAGQAGVIDHVRVGDDAVVGGQAGVGRDVPDRTMVLGSPALPHLEHKRQLSALARLPLLRKTIAALEARVAALEAQARG